VLRRACADDKGTMLARLHDDDTSVVNCIGADERAWLIESAPRVMTWPITMRARDRAGPAIGRASGALKKPLLWRTASDRIARMVR
jgi:hypothetical protein